jgi:hypothetical protein
VAPDGAASRTACRPVSHDTAIAEPGGVAAKAGDVDDVLPGVGAAGVDGGGLTEPAGADPAGVALTAGSTVAGRIRVMPPPIATTAIATSPTATGRLLPRFVSVPVERRGGCIAGRDYRFRPMRGIDDLLGAVAGGPITAPPRARRPMLGVAATESAAWGRNHR